MQLTLKKNRNKALCKLLVVLILIGTALFSCSDSDESSQSLSEDGHVMGSVWAMVYPTNLLLRLADHTYISAIDTGGNTYDWLCFGNGSEGDELSGTLTEFTADITTVGFMASEPPCKWPLEYYLVIGVCHQCANRALYYTDKTVVDSRGYDFFTSIYGTYGDESISESHTYSMKRCIEAAPLWQGGATSSASASLSGKSIDDDFPGEEKQLYRDYLQQKQTNAFNMSQDDLYSGYLDKLFRMRIRKKLGVDFSYRTVDQLVGLRNQYREMKMMLDREIQLSRLPAEELLARYEILFNNLANGYKLILTPLEYETLFNLSYYQGIELDDILPRSR
jgi:hypothetical protein